LEGKGGHATLTPPSHKKRGRGSLPLPPVRVSRPFRVWEKKREDLTPSPLTHRKKKKKGNFRRSSLASAGKRGPTLRSFQGKGGKGTWCLCSYLARRTGYYLLSSQGKEEERGGASPFSKASVRFFEARDRRKGGRARPFPPAKREGGGLAFRRSTIRILLKPSLR